MIFREAREYIAAQLRWRGKEHAPMNYDAKLWETLDAIATRVAVNESALVHLQHDTRAKP